MITYRVFSSGVRFCHWTIAACMVVLFATGLYIGSPGYIGTQGKEPFEAVAGLFSMETIRFIHFSAAFVFCACLLLRFYLLFTYRGNRLFVQLRSREFWRGMVEVALYYMFIRRSHKFYLRNPLARLTYTFIYLFMLAEVVTGLAMYVMIRPNTFWGSAFTPLINLLGGEYRVHLIHHIIAWMFAIFVIGHIYLVFLTDIKEKNSELSAMVSGRKHYDDQPVDAHGSLIERREPPCTG